MSAPYTEDDTERARQQERLGPAMTQQPLQQVQNPYGDYTLPPAQEPALMRPPAWLGAILLAMGAFIFASGGFEVSGDMTGGLVLLTIASCFWFFAVWKRVFGLMIPAAILTGLGMGIPFAALTYGTSVLWGLASGFMAIAVLGPMLFGTRSSWAIYPAVPLFAVGLLVLVINIANVLNLGLLLPVLIMAVGVWMLTGAKTPSKP